jgi:hypothetical protein
VDGIASFDVAALRIDDELDVIVVERGQKDQLLANFACRFLADFAEEKNGARLEKFFLKLGLGLLLLLDRLFFFLLLLGLLRLG